MKFNADGLDFHGLNKILCWLQLGLAGGVYVVDARCNGREKERWTVATRAALGSHAQLYMSAIAPIVRSGKEEDRARVGGSIIILNNYWGVRAYDWFKDDSDLGLVMGVYIKLPHTKLLWMGAYWLVSAPTVDLAGLTTSDRLAHRTTA